MAGLLPLVRGGKATCLYPVTRTVEFLTGVRTHLNFTEQRWKRRPPFTRFVLPYSSMTAAETTDIRNFFDSQKGSFDSTWDFVMGRAITDGAISSDGTITGGSGTILASPMMGFTSIDTGKDVVVEGAGPGGGLFTTTIGVTEPTFANVLTAGFVNGATAAIRIGRLYRNMVLEQDTLPMVEREEKLYNFTLTARQTANATFTMPSVATSYPSMAIGLKAQRPYTRIQRYAVLKNSNTFGPQYTWTWIGGGLAGFPADALHGWQLDYPVITDADLATLENFFLAHWGRFATFDFVDPDNATTYHNVRFESDSLEIHHDQIGISSVSVKLLETNG